LLGVHHARVPAGWLQFPPATIHDFVSAAPCTRSSTQYQAGPRPPLCSSGSRATRTLDRNDTAADDRSDPQRPRQLLRAKTLLAGFSARGFVDQALSRHAEHHPLDNGDIRRNCSDRDRARAIAKFTRSIGVLHTTPVSVRASVSGAAATRQSALQDLALPSCGRRSMLKIICTCVDP